MTGDQFLAWIETLKGAALPALKRDDIAKVLADLTPEQIQHCLDTIQAVSGLLAAMTTVITQMTEKAD